MRIEMNDPGSLDIQTHRIGRDRNAVLVVDNVLKEPDKLRELALQMGYLAGNERNYFQYYPGYLAHCDLPGLKRISRWVAEYMWKEVYGLAVDLPLGVSFDNVCAHSHFAMYAPNPDAEFINIHADNHSWLAVLIYLVDHEGTSGTALWRHRPTQLESCFQTDDAVLGVQKAEMLFQLDVLGRLRDAFILSPEVSIAKAFEQIRGPAIKPPFPGESHGDWELLHRVEARFNRLVAYPTWQWHSVAYPDYTPPKSVEDARITLNTWVDYPLGGLSQVLPVAPIPGL